MHLKNTACAGTIGLALLLSACAADDPHKRTKTGVAVGAVAGAVIGNQTSSRNGKYIGAAVGALTGAAVGNYMDRQQRKLERELAAERRAQTIRVVRIDDETLKVDISSEASFDINSARVKPGFRDSLNKVAEVVGEYEKTIVHVIGHTDNTGSTSYNQQLSEKRAASVGQQLGSSGVNRQRMRLSGLGESKPIDSNDTSSGRSRNRRVEIYLKPIVEGRENEATRAPV